MSGALPMGDNLRGLLTELAESGEPTMLGLRARQFDDLMRPDKNPGLCDQLSAVEAELLRAHRDELANLLLLGGRLVHQGSDRVHLTPRTASGSAVPTQKRTLMLRGEGLVSQHHGVPHHGAKRKDALGLLASLITPEARRPSATELALASLRLVPSDATRIWLGVFLDAEGDPERGRELHQSTLQTGPTSFLASYAWSNIAAASLREARYSEAMEAARSATLCDGSLARGPALWLLSAVQAGDEAESRLAASFLQQFATGPETELAEIRLVAENPLTKGTWQLSRPGLAVKRRTLGQLPQQAEMILEALS